MDRHAESSGRHRYQLRINGIKEEGGVVSSINGLETPNPTVRNSQYIYDLNGRLVRNNGSDDGLAKGIYIRNGKKMVIK